MSGIDENDVIKVIRRANNTGSVPSVATVGQLAEVLSDAPTAVTGWGNYVDTQYTSESAFSLGVATPAALPNNKGAVIESQLPDDVDTFYNGTTITGRNGDGILITVDLKAIPTDQNTTYLEIWFDIGSPVGELYRRIITFPKGNGEVRPINFTVAGYTLDTWETNGATVYAQSNNTCDLYDIRYVITRTHKAR